MKGKIALIPMDARPVTRDLAVDLARIAGWEVITPEKSLLGFLKQPAKLNDLYQWLWDIVHQVDGIVLSIDMLLYGGLVPSRIHTESDQKLRERLNILKKIKKTHPQIQIMAFSSTMRISNNNINEEEKDYWKDYGKYLWSLSYHSHKYEKLKDESIAKIIKNLYKKIPAAIVRDYQQTRKRHFRMNLKLIDLVEIGVIDHLVFPQDDTSEYGWNIKEQEILQQKVIDTSLFQRIAIYPGADEVANTLVTKLIFLMEQIPLPRYYPIYSGGKGKLSISLYEDRPLVESVKGQIAAIGSHTVEAIEEADILLGVNVPGIHQGDLALQTNLNSVDTPDRNIQEWLRKLQYYMSKNKRVAIADIAYANGADPIMVKQMLEWIHWQDLFGYAGWNTSGNTLGTVISHSALTFLAEKKKIDFYDEHAYQLVLRLLDDYLYQSVVRAQVRKEIEEDEVSATELLAYIAKVYRQAALAFLHKYRIPFSVSHIYLPWNRTFEIGLQLTKLAKKNRGGD